MHTYSGEYPAKQLGAFQAAYIEESGAWHLRVGAIRIAQSPLLLLASLLVGIGAGCCTMLFRSLIQFEHDFAFGWLAPHSQGLLGALGLVVPLAAGGALTAAIVTSCAPEAKGHGVPEVIAALRQKGGVMRPRVIVVKMVSAATSIGFGGSCGREGPVVFIGSAVGSAFGQLARFPPSMLRTIVAAGAAGGLSSTFDAPIGGVFFACEVILRDFSAHSLAVVLTASVSAIALTRHFFGSSPLLTAAPLDLVSPQELGCYAVLGIAAAVWGTSFVRFLHWIERRFISFRLSPIATASLGFSLVGIIGIAFPDVLGMGYPSIQHMLDGKLSAWNAFLLSICKPIATSFTLGSGGSGGMLAPLLFTGAMLGGSFGHLVHTAFPLWTALPAAYGFVGMAATFAAATEAPLASIALVTEISHEHTLILPLMLCCAVSTLMGRHLSRI